MANKNAYFTCQNGIKWTLPDSYRGRKNYFQSSTIRNANKRGFDGVDFSVIRVWSSMLESLISFYFFLGVNREWPGNLFPFLDFMTSLLYNKFLCPAHWKSINFLYTFFSESSVYIWILWEQLIFWVQTVFFFFFSRLGFYAFVLSSASFLI